MADRMFGLETEYSYTALGPRGGRLSSDNLTEFLALARSTFPHLPDSSRSSGIFLQNGARFYRDSGDHPEMTTPEVVNPWDACRYLLGGDRILAQLARQQAAADRKIGRVIVSKSNVSYGGAPATWACHESYAHKASLDALPRHLVPHLVSRIIYTGAGGFDNKSPGLVFLISPRVAHLENVISDSSQSNRGIYHTKNESLADSGHSRLHVLCGESLCSETAIWLKMATTVLVVALIEAGLNPGDGVQLQSPLEAMHAFARDVKLRATAESTNGQPLTALHIQRHYLQQAEADAEAPFMPPWAPQACEKWRAVLDRLESDHAALAKTLDWAIKLDLYRRHARRRGFEWRSLTAWNELLHDTAAGLLPTEGPETTSRTLPASLFRKLMAQPALIAEQLRRLPALRKKRLDPRHADQFFSLRNELFELDTRFGELSDRGIFASLDAAGVLEHHVEGVDHIEQAISTPPAVGRARLRGECVRRFAGSNGRFCCDWTGIWDYENHRYLDLADPFATEEVWREFTDRQPEHAIRHEQFDLLVRRVWQLYDRGDYEQAHRCLQQMLRHSVVFGPARCRSLQRLAALVQARRGFLDGRDLLNQVYSQGSYTIEQINDFACIERFRGLAPSPELSGWMELGQQYLQQHDHQNRFAAVAFHEHRGYELLCRGRLDESVSVLESACADDLDSLPAKRVVGRARALLGEVYRRLGRLDGARTALSQAGEIHRRYDFLGDLAEFTLTGLLKVETNANRRQELLHEIRAIQTNFNHRMGEAKTLLIEARRCSTGERTATIQQRLLELKTQTPALAQCPLLDRILNAWPAWTSGAAIAGTCDDDFCGD